MTPQGGWVGWLLPADALVGPLRHAGGGGVTLGPAGALTHDVSGWSGSAKTKISVVMLLQKCLLWVLDGEVSVLHVSRPVCRRHVRMRPDPWLLHLHYNSQTVLCESKCWLTRSQFLFTRTASEVQWPKQIVIDAGPNSAALVLKSLEGHQAIDWWGQKGFLGKASQWISLPANYSTRSSVRKWEQPPHTCWDTDWKFWLRPELPQLFFPSRSFQQDFEAFSYWTETLF